MIVPRRNKLAVRARSLHALSLVSYLVEVRDIVIREPACQTFLERRPEASLAPVTTGLASIALLLPIVPVSAVLDTDSAL